MAALASRELPRVLIGEHLMVVQLGDVLKVVLVQFVDLLIVDVQVVVLRLLVLVLQSLPLGSHLLSDGDALVLVV